LVLVVEGEIGMVVKVLEEEVQGGLVSCPKPIMEGVAKVVVIMLLEKVQVLAG
jgi:hypothetical protein